MKYISFKQPYAELLVAGRKIGDKAIMPGRETISSMQHSEEISYDYYLHAILCFGTAE